MEGFERGKNLKKMGMHSQDTAEMFFNNVKVPREKNVHFFKELIAANPPTPPKAELKFEEPQVDLSTLSAEARELIRTVVSVAGLIGLYLIWEDALPALRVFEDIVLWHSTVTVDGTEETLGRASDGTERNVTTPCP